MSRIHKPNQISKSVFTDQLCLWMFLAIAIWAAYSSMADIPYSLLMLVPAMFGFAIFGLSFYVIFIAKDTHDKEE